jgi:ubiquinone biosynthesis monooxygenase Coq7
MTDAERQESARLMRVNHVGEVCAQALYQSQAVTARSNRVRQTMVQAAAEESDHLNWCEGRLRELGGRKSLLNSLWYAGAFAIGSAAGLAGDRWNLGFLEETEKRVEGHLASHLDRLPASDTRSRAVVEVMKQDEHRHACSARAAGALDLPQPVKRLMQAASRVMTTAAYWL